MKKIKLTQGQFALVDDADYEWLNQYKWYACKIRGNFYAVRHSPVENRKRHTILMSRQILGLNYGDSREADHRNHNTLDNRRNNIRICTHQQNMGNRKLTLNTSSRFKGVTWDKAKNRWKAQICINGRQTYLGLFLSEKKAALAFNDVSKKYHGEFACLNQI